MPASTTSQTSMPASLHDLLAAADPESLTNMFTAIGRHQLLGGKTANLLRAGDRIALRDLDPERDDDHITGEVAEVTDAVPTEDRLLIVVTTTEHGTWRISSQRLLVVTRS